MKIFLPTDTVVIEKQNFPKCDISIMSKPTQGTKGCKFKLADIKTILSMDKLQHGFSISTFPVLISYQNFSPVFSQKIFCQLFINRKIFEGEMLGFYMEGAFLFTKYSEIDLSAAKSVLQCSR